MTERILVAHIDDRVVGTLRGDQDIWSFKYDARWLADPTSFALSPALPLGDRVVDGSTRRPVQWFFDNLLPEEAQRTLMARDAGIRNEGDAFALLVHYGAESAGSLTLLPPGVALAQPSRWPLSDDALSARIAALPRCPCRRSSKEDVTGRRAA